MQSVTQMTNKAKLEQRAIQYRKTTDKYRTRVEAVQSAIARLESLASARGIAITKSADFVPVSNRSRKSTAYSLFVRIGDGDVVPTITFRDSMNGETATFIDFGLYRKVCSNGLHVATGGTEEMFKQTHVRDWKLTDENIVTIFDMACSLATNFVDKYTAIAAPESAYITRNKLLQRLATNGVITESQAATAMRYGLRYYDNKPTMFHVINAVQESLTTNRNGRKKQTAANAQLNRSLIPAIQQAASELYAIAA